MMRVIIILAFLSQTAGSWEAHYLLTYFALRDWPEVSKEPTIIAEPLENFVKSQKEALVLLLKEQEVWAQKNISTYPRLPDELVFNARSDSPSLTKEFLMALRINPESSYANFLLYPPGVPHRLKNGFTPQELVQSPLTTLTSLRAEQPVLEKILPGQRVSALEILVAASEEPDHGLDLGLWQDNQTHYGAIMGFGTQPFGNPALSYSSQAPFHMGYFYESPVLYWAAGWLKRCYPEYRINTFLGLSRFAFSHGHSYWGYRFLGWALHYIQDLTQPYHATLAPGVSWPKLMWLNILEIIGIKGPAENLRQLLTNRHLGLENYQFESIRAIANNINLFGVLSNEIPDREYPLFSPTYARQIIAKEARSRADQVDFLLNQALPSLYVADPTYKFSGTDPSINLREISFVHETTAAMRLEQEFLVLMRSFAAHTRTTIRSTRPQSSLSVVRHRALSFAWRD